MYGIKPSEINTVYTFTKFKRIISEISLFLIPLAIQHHLLARRTRAGQAVGKHFRIDFPLWTALIGRGATKTGQPIYTEGNFFAK